MTRQRGPSAQEDPPPTWCRPEVSYSSLLYLCLKPLERLESRLGNGGLIFMRLIYSSGSDPGGDEDRVVSLAAGG